MKHISGMAGSILGLFSLAFFSSSPALAGLQETRSIIRNSDSSFLVICTNGETETATTQKIIDNLVCEDEETTEVEEKANPFICTGDDFMDRFQITRISNGDLLGGRVSLERCRQLITDASDEFICTGDDFMDRFQITRISNGDLLGGRVSLSTCTQLITDASDEFICTGDEFMDRFQLTRISNGERLGGRVSLSTCTQLVNNQ